MGSHSNHQTLVMDTKRLMKKIDQVVLKFGYREINGVAEYLAKKEASLQLQTFKSVTSEL